jgi:predicted dehydrogenase
VGPDSWHRDRSQNAGGPLFEAGCHRVEVLLNILGPVAKSAGQISKAAFDWELDDTGVAALLFESRTIGTIAYSLAVREERNTLHVFGTEGSLHVPDLIKGTLAVRDAQGSEVVEEHPPHPNLHMPLVEDFTQAVLQDRSPAVDGRVGLDVARVEEEIYGPAS